MGAFSKHVGSWTGSNGFRLMPADSPHVAAATAEVSTAAAGSVTSDGVTSEGVTSDGRLNLIYNACDVGLNTAMGEGWGLVSLEHAATGAAQIVPNHSACAEIWDGAALLLDPVTRGVPAFSPLELATVSAAQVAEALERLYADRRLLHHLSVTAYGVATRAGYTWEAIADQWGELFRDLTPGGRAAWTTP